MFLHSLLRSPDLLAAGSTGSVFKGRRSDDEVFLPRKDTVEWPTGAPWALNHGLLQEMPLHLPAGFSGGHWGHLCKKREKQFPS